MLTLLYLRLTRKNSAAFDSLFEDDGKQQNRIENKSGALLSGLAYCISSCSMILLNKAILSGYNFTAGVSLMLYQVNMDLNQKTVVLINVWHQCNFRMSSSVSFNYVNLSFVFSVWLMKFT